MDLHRVVFLLVSGLSMLHSVCVDKMLFLSVIYEDEKYSTLALSGFWTMAKLTAIVILGWEHEKIERLLGSMEKYESTYTNLRFRLGARRKLKYLMYFVFISTLGTVALEIWTIYNLGLEKALLMGSHTLAKCLFLWKDGNLSEKAFLLKYEYGSELTLETAVMGGILIASEILSILHTGLMLGFIMLVAVATHTYFAELLRDIREFRGDRRTEKVREWKRNPEKSVQFWKKLSLLTDVIEDANDAFGEIFKLQFILCMFWMGSVLPMSFLGTETTCFWIFLLSVVFVEVWFLYAGKIAEQNDELFEWIATCGVLIGRVRIGRKVVDPRLILMELAKKPMGLGIGRYIIRYTHHYIALMIYRKMWGAIFGRGDDN